MAIAYSYLRFSSPKQAKGDSARRQMEWPVKWCEENGHTLDTTLKLTDKAISAWKGKNRDTGALGVFLKLAKEGHIKKGSYLLVENLDRLSRETQTKALALIQEIVATGIIIVTCKPYRVITQENIDRDLGVLIEIIIAGYRANEESEIKSMRVAAKKEDRRNKLREHIAKNGSPKTAHKIAKGPSWLRLDEDKVTWIKIPQAVSVVQKIFKLYVGGMGTQAIVKKFNQEGIKPIARKEWNESSVKLILNNRNVLGEYQPCKGYGSKKDRIPQGDPIPNYYPRIIDDATYYKAQEQAKRNKKGVSSRPSKQISNLFTGLLYDAENGSTYQVQQTKVLRLVTYGHRKGVAECCPFPLSVFEEAFLEWTTEIKASDLTPQESDQTDMEENLEALVGKIADLNHKIEAIKAKMIEGDNFASYLDVLAKLETAKKTAETEAETIKGQLTTTHSETLEDTKRLIHQLAKGDLETRERLKTRIAILIDRIDLWALRDDERNLWAFVQVHFPNSQTRLFIVKAKSKYGKGYEWATIGLDSKRQHSQNLDLRNKQTRQDFKFMYVDGGAGQMKMPPMKHR